jgi:hypothetical protein
LRAHVVPHAPQLKKSFFVFTHEFVANPPAMCARHAVVPVGHAPVTHLPPVHTCPMPHAAPQLPQLSPSVLVSKQPLPPKPVGHELYPGRQAQVPAPAQYSPPPTARH